MNLHQDHPVNRGKIARGQGLSTIALRAVDCQVDVRAIVDNVAIARVVTEDLCWQIAEAEHRASRPPRRRRRTERASWRADRDALCVQRSEIMREAAAAGLPARLWGAHSWLSGGW